MKPRHRSAEPLRSLANPCATSKISRISEIDRSSIETRWRDPVMRCREGMLPDRALSRNRAAPEALDRHREGLGLDGAQARDLAREIARERNGFPRGPRIRRESERPPERARDDLARRGRLTER